MPYDDCERCGSVRIDDEHKCLPSVRMRYQEKKSRTRILELEYKVVWLDRLLAVADTQKLGDRLDNIETDIELLLNRVRDLEEMRHDHD